MDIIIATKNDQHTIHDCLKSLKRQTIPCRIIVVDGKSTDKTVEIAKEFGCEVYDEPDSPNHRKCAEARNEGLRYSSSELIGFVDADAVFPPRWAEDLSGYLHKNPDVVGVTSGCEWKGGSDFALAIHRVIQIGSSHASEFKENTELDSIATYNVVYRREALDSIDARTPYIDSSLGLKNTRRPLIFDESLGGCEDWELNHRLRKKGYKLMGIPISPAEHFERQTLKGFAKQMFHYAWARARVTKLKKIYTLFHALPSIALLSLIVVMCLFPPRYVIAVFAQYVLVLLLASFYTNRKDSNRFFSVSLHTFYVFLTQHFSWAFGYLKGWVT